VSLRIAEIFGPTVQGEGALIGAPTVFVRAGGCDYRCVWCDSLHAVDSAYRHDWAAMTPDEVWARVRQLSGGRPLTVTLSGGNPAIQDFGPLIALGRAGIGMGDAKLTAAIGALSASWQMVLDSVVYALVVCLLWCVWIMVRQRIVKRTLGRLFGAAMMAGARAKVEFPDDSPRVPIGAAIAVGASVAGIEHLLGGELPWSWLTS